MNAEISTAWNKIQATIDGFIALLPNIVLAFVVFILFFFVARWLKSIVKRLTRKHRQARNLGMVLGRLAQGNCAPNWVICRIINRNSDI